MTQVGQAGRCTTADRSLPGSWDAERQVHRCTGKRCTCKRDRYTGAHMKEVQEGQVHRYTCKRAASVHRSVGDPGCT